MRAAILIALMCSPVMGQFTVTNRCPFVVTDRAVCKPQATQPKRYLAMFTATWCGPCQGWKKAQQPKIEAAGFTVRIYEMTDAKNQRKYGGRIHRYPTFVWCDWETGKWLSDPVVNAVSAEYLMDEPTGTKADPISSCAPERNPSLFGQRGTSHASRASLIHHLLNDGIHRGRWDLAKLNAMSDDALNEAHNDYHGW